MLLSLFAIHYINRTIIFPLRLRGGKPTAFLVFAMATVFTTLNGYVQARTLTRFKVYPESWLTDPRFLVGVGVFCCGMAINCHGSSRRCSLARSVSLSVGGSVGRRSLCRLVGRLSNFLPPTGFRWTRR